MRRLLTGATLLVVCVLLAAPVPADTQQRGERKYGYAWVTATCNPGRTNASQAMLVSEVFAYCPPTVTAEGILAWDYQNNRVVGMYQREAVTAAAALCGGDYRMLNASVDGGYTTEAQAEQFKASWVRNAGVPIHSTFLIAPSWYCPVSQK